MNFPDPFDDLDCVVALWFLLGSVALVVVLALVAP